MAHRLVTCQSGSWNDRLYRHSQNYQHLADQCSFQALLTNIHMNTLTVTSMLLTKPWFVCTLHLPTPTIFHHFNSLISFYFVPSVCLFYVWLFIYLFFSACNPHNSTNYFLHSFSSFVSLFYAFPFPSLFSFHFCSLLFCCV